MTTALLCLASAAVGGIIGFIGGVTLMFVSRRSVPFVVLSTRHGTAPEQDADASTPAKKAADALS